MVKLLKALLENGEGRTVKEEHITELKGCLSENEIKVVKYKDVFYVNIIGDCNSKIENMLEGIKNESKETQYFKRLIRQKEFLLNPDRKDEVLGYLHENGITHELLEVAGREFVLIK